MTLFAAWHSRFAPGVALARTWLAGRRIDRVSVVWREDVRTWHPKQHWIWEADGPGVFDPGINALSILTHIMPHLVHVSHATLMIPKNRAAPIAAKLAFRAAACSEMTMDLDWRQTGRQIWDIAVETDEGNLRLTDGGAMLSLPTGTVNSDAQEYPTIYNHFATLIGAGLSDVDVTPLRLVADAFLRGRREVVGAFHD
jgi:D-galactose 1-dehydrogenase